MSTYQTLSRFNLRLGATIIASALLLVACGERPPEKKATQVAAKVNGNEISVHQINFVTQRMPGVQPSQAEAIKRQVLASLVDQELAVQQALEAKLERTPEVMQAIENARREILARAYLDQVAGSRAAPAAEEIRKYYADNPALFAQRKIYQLEEVSFANSPAAIARVKELIAGGSKLAEIVAALKADGVQLGNEVVIKPAEQIPLEILPRIASAQDGRPLLIESTGRAVLLSVISSKAEPVDESKATGAIASFLVNSQKSEAARQALQQLRAKATIEYVGEFANSQPPAASEAAAPSKAVEGKTDAVITKGVAGLK